MNKKKVDYDMYCDACRLVKSETEFILNFKNFVKDYNIKGPQTLKLAKMIRDLSKEFAKLMNTNSDDEI